MAFYKKFSPDRRGGKGPERREGSRTGRGSGYGPARRGEVHQSEGYARPAGKGRPQRQDDRQRGQNGGYEPRGRRGAGDRYAFGQPPFGRPQPNPASHKRFGPGNIPRTATGPSRPLPRAERIDHPPQAPFAGPSMQEQEAPTPPENLLSGRNPIREALKANRDIEKLMVASGELSGSAREIVAMAKNAGIIVQTVERSRLDQITRHHQGMVAFASAYAYASVEDILQAAKDRGEAPFIIILDKITDPQNLGAIIRTAACMGAHGVIVQLHRAVGLTPSAVRASAGAVEHVRVARVVNLNNTIKELKRQGIWLYAADTKGTDYRQVRFEGGCALVIGNEGEGVSALTLSLCDQSVAIPMSGLLDSLNASVAAGILMHAVYLGRHQ